MNIKELLKGDITQQELLNYYNVTIQYQDFSGYLNGLVFHYKGYNLIFINENLSYYKKKENYTS